MEGATSPDIGATPTATLARPYGVHPTAMSLKLKFWETVLRDGQQSLWATRMTTPMIAPIARTMGECGYWCMEVMSGAVYEASYHYNAEDPWERVRLVARTAGNAHVAAIVRSLSVFGWSTLPDEVFPFAMKLMAGNGITLVNLFDGLNDTANMSVALKAARAEGLHVATTLIFTESPVHTDDYYIAKTQELLALGAGSIILEDAASLMTTARLRSLISKMRAAIGDDVLFHFQTHCASGLGPLNTLSAIDLGIDVVQTAVSPLAHGTSNPPTEMIAREALESGMDVGLNLAKVEQVADHFREQAAIHDKPLGRPTQFEPSLSRHQVPGGMRSNLESQLAALGMRERLPEVLDEISRIRQELGWPIMVTPISQFVGVQALFNVIEGERYKTVQADLANYVLGWFGEVPGTIDPDIFDRLGEGREPITERPGSLAAPIMATLEAEEGPFRSDEERFAALQIAPNMRLRGELARRLHPSRSILRTPVATLLRELTHRPDISRVFLRKGNTTFNYTG